jgi:hypothetical protein
MSLTAFGTSSFLVMPGLDPGIHAFLTAPFPWMAGTSPAMTD